MSDELTPYLSELLSAAKQSSMKRIISDVVLADEPFIALRNWREKFGISQKNLATRMGISASVISDYETGRRKNPGISFLKTYVQSLVEDDAERGGANIMELLKMEPILKGIILDIKEYSKPVSMRKIVEAVDGKAETFPDLLSDFVFGHTVLDSVKTVLYFKWYDMVNVFGYTNVRALVFTNVQHGRSPLVAIHLFPFKPKMIVLHGPKSLDPVAAEIAKVDGIVVALSKLGSTKELIERLSTIGQ
ncbi:MAG: helix-turn-helix domain-containing protein [Thermoproteota archaeon]